MIFLELLYKGTIARLFRTHSAIGKVTGPLDLPSNNSQCVHLATEWLSEGAEMTRCTNVSDRESQCGYLCREHQNTPAPRFIPRRDLDFEIVDGIIKTEKRALEGATRERVRLTTKGAYITYLKSERKKILDDLMEVEMSLGCGG